MGLDQLLLDDRAVISVTGEDGRTLLQRLLTNDVEALAPGEARYAALLTPQGKMLTDFIAVVPPTSPDEILLDLPVSQSADLLKRLTLYRLRAKVTISDRSAQLAVVAFRDQAPTEAVIVTYADPRSAAIWKRAIVERALAPIGEEARETYELIRIAAGVPAGGIDFAYGDTFPHEANLDHLNGVDFKKGCYVGQEVVSRVHHRGTARKRIVVATFEGSAPPPGTDVTAGDTVVGTLGLAVGTTGLATVRIDRVRELGGPFMAAGIPLQLSLPAWA